MSVTQFPHVTQVCEGYGDVHLCLFAGREGWGSPAEPRLGLPTGVGVTRET